MRKTGVSTLLHLLSVLLLLALTGCGASNSKTVAGSTSGALEAKLVWGGNSKTAAKAVALVPAGVTKVRLTVSGAGVPVVRNELAVTSGSTGQGQVNGIYPGQVSLVVQGLDASGAVLYEGFALNLVVSSGNTTDAGTITMKVPTVKAADLQCQACHETTLDATGQNLVAEFKQSGHYTNLGFTDQNGVGTGCAGCHGPSHNVADPSGAGRCAECHGPTVNGNHHSTTYLYAGGQVHDDVCSTCHNSHNPFGPFVGGSCVACHAFPQNKTDRGNYVNDNNGVRAIVAEFSKRSHHITGGAPTDAQCAVCHLEGKAVNGAVTVDTRYHMKDAKIYLRNVDNAAGVFAWDGADHTAMDNFCFACHDANGASDVATLKGLLPAATAMNPFADTLTNSYDQVARPGVIDVKTAFTTTNASHHAVSGQRYKYRFSTRVNADTWAIENGHSAGYVPDAEIAEFHVGEASPNGGTITAFDATKPYDEHGPLEGGDATLYEAGKFVATYTPLGASQNVADNSTLHCGDCHTVGQWKPGSSTSADGSLTPVAIGAHGSNNDYLLRNSLGTDALHSSQSYVCFNCHKNPAVQPATAALWDELVAAGEISSTVVKPTWKAGWNALHPNVFAGQVSGYTTAHSVSAFHAQCIADSSAQTGSSTTTLSRAYYTTGGGHKDRLLDFIPAPGATAAVPSTGGEGGNVTGIGCTNCHNSGLRSGWGGIHGGNADYVDGLGRAQKSYRFMPGMGNYRYAPPGGWDGRDTSDPSLLTQAGSGVGAGKPMGGCYTSGTTNGDTNPGFSSCAHHGTSTAQTTAAGQAAGFRASYGGGTTATPTAVEPTVREATAGNTLVTRPLKY